MGEAEEGKMNEIPFSFFFFCMPRGSITLPHIDLHYKSTFYAPLLAVVNSISPNSGSLSGQTQITISGTGTGLHACLCIILMNILVYRLQHGPVCFH